MEWYRSSCLKSLRPSWAMELVNYLPPLSRWISQVLHEDCPSGKYILHWPIVWHSIASWLSESDIMPEFNFSPHFLFTWGKELRMFRWNFSWKSLFFDGVPVEGFSLGKQNSSPLEPTQVSIAYILHRSLWEKWQKCHSHTLTLITIQCGFATEKQDILCLPDAVPKLIP